MKVGNLEVEVVHPGPRLVVTCHSVVAAVETQVTLGELNGLGLYLSAHARRVMRERGLTQEGQAERGLLVSHDLFLQLIEHKEKGT